MRVSKIQGRINPKGSGLIYIFVVGMLQGLVIYGYSNLGSPDSILGTVALATVETGGVGVEGSAGFRAGGLKGWGGAYMSYHGLRFGPTQHGFYHVLPGLGCSVAHIRKHRQI